MWKKQTDRQTNAAGNPTPATTVGVVNVAYKALYYWPMTNAYITHGEQFVLLRVKFWATVWFRRVAGTRHGASGRSSTHASRTTDSAACRKTAQPHCNIRIDYCRGEHVSRTRHFWLLWLFDTPRQIFWSGQTWGPRTTLCTNYRV